MRATRVGRDTALARIVELVQRAQGSKAPIQRLADRISEVFVPAVLVVAVATFVVWFAFGPEPRLTLALTAFIGVVIIACPCAMGLATPTAIMVGTGKGAEAGILVRGGEALEAAGRVDTVVFDKTGTLTLGRPVVTAIAAGAPASTRRALLDLAASLEQAVASTRWARRSCAPARERELGFAHGGRVRGGRRARRGRARSTARACSSGARGCMHERGSTSRRSPSRRRSPRPTGATLVYVALDGAAAGVDRHRRPGQARVGRGGPRAARGRARGVAAHRRRAGDRRRRARARSASPRIT